MKFNKVLVVAAHPDDEILGCGATMAKHVAAGDEVHVLVLAEGLTSRTNNRCETNNEELVCLRSAAKEANTRLGVTSVVLNTFPDNRMDGIERLEVIKLIEDCIQRLKPTIIYTHHAGDVNIDHQIVHHAVVVACRPMIDCSVKTILMFETLSSTEWQIPPQPVFSPNWFVDITEFVEKKLWALEAYGMEMRQWPHPRSPEGVIALSKWRGSMIGVKAAEAFMLGRRRD